MPLDYVPQTRGPSDILQEYGASALAPYYQASSANASRQARDALLADALATTQQPAQPEPLQIAEQKIFGGQPVMPVDYHRQVASSLLGASGGSTVETVFLNLRGIANQWLAARAEKRDRQREAQQWADAAAAIENYRTEGGYDYERMLADPAIMALPQYAELISKKLFEKGGGDQWKTVTYGDDGTAVSQTYLNGEPFGSTFTDPEKSAQPHNWQKISILDEDNLNKWWWADPKDPNKPLTPIIDPRTGVQAVGLPGEVSWMDRLLAPPGTPQDQTFGLPGVTGNPLDSQ